MQSSGESPDRTEDHPPGCASHLQQHVPEVISMVRILILAGVFLLAAGLLVMVRNRLGLPRGRLPGDLSWRGKHVSVFAPLGTSLLLSLRLSLALLLFNYLRR